MVPVEDARKAIQLIQYSIRGMAEILVSGEKIDETLVVDAAYCVLSSATMIDLYLTHNVSTRKERQRESLDTQGALRFVSAMTPFRLPLSAPDCTLTISWPRDGADIFHLESPDVDITARWEALFAESD